MSDKDKVWGDRAGAESNRLVRGSLGFVSVDLGTLKDYTAVTILVKSRIYILDQHTEQIEYAFRWIERFALGTPYPRIIDRVEIIMKNPTLRDAALLVDCTGVGLPVVDVMRDRDMNPTPITITGGHQVHQQKDGGFHVPKKSLITSLLVLFQSGQLKIAQGLSEAPQAVAELENFRVKQKPSGHEELSAWREGDHDDIVLSMALGTWFASQVRNYLDELGDDEGDRSGEKAVRDYDPLGRGRKNR